MVMTQGDKSSQFILNLNKVGELELMYEQNNSSCFVVIYYIFVMHFILSLKMFNR